MLICTISTANHLPKAICLANSLAQTQPRHQFLLCLVERDRTGLEGLETSLFRVVLGSEIGIPNFDAFVFRYTALEACMSVKARILLWAIQAFAEEQHFLYLDSDILAYSRFEELESVLTNAEIVVTPHHVYDETSQQGIYDNMIRTLACGTFNSGFLAVRRSPKSQEFLEWWDNKLQGMCYKDLSRGLYFEQRWLELALSFFDFTVLREPGYNVANWNISKCNLTAHGNPSEYLVNGKPLRFFHYSMAESGQDMFFFKRQLQDANPVFQMRDDYLNQVRSFDASGLTRIPWSYGRFRSGESIADETRHIFRDLPGLMSKFENPFEASNSTLAEAEAQTLRKQ